MINKNGEPPFLAARRLTLVRVVGVEPTRITSQEPKGDVTLVNGFEKVAIAVAANPYITVFRNTFSSHTTPSAK